MAEKDLESEKLELSLFGRKRRKDKKKSADDADAPAAAPPAEPAGTAEPSEQTRRPEPVERSEPAAPGPSAGRAATPRAEPAADAPTAALPTTPPATTGGGATAVGDDTIASSSGPATRASTTSGGRRVRGARKATAPRRQLQAPSMAAPAATLVVGAVVGLAAVALTYASLKACELFTGTDSCGGPGLFVLLAVVVLMILGGSAALSMLGVPESGGISFLGVAMFVALCLVVLLPSLLEPWMIVVAPVLCALTYLLAHWIVTRFDEDILETDGPPQHDVR